MTKLDLLAATALSILAAAPAVAQEQGPATGPDTAASPTEQGAVQNADDFTSANDIVVTATRRNETVQEVPIAITAVNTELLENAGVQDIRGLEQLAPSLQTTTGQSSSNASSLSIRGIGTAGDNPGFEPAVGVFIDGVFRPRAGIAVAELPELERVEVLRGPQGTLFGRNTSAGALSIFTAQPQFELGGYVEGSYGNYDAVEFNGAVTGPVSRQLALRLDAGYRKRDGYIKDANSDRSINDIDRYFIRGQALYDTSTLSFRLIGDYYETDEQCCGAVNLVAGPTAAAIQQIAGAQGLVGLYTGDPADRTQAMSPNRDYMERVRDWGISGELNADIGDFKLTSITAYRSWRTLRNQDIDFSGIDRAYREGYRNELDDFTQEIRLQGTIFDGVLDFLVGGFYLNETNKLRDTVHFGNDANRYVDTVLAGALARPVSAGGIGTPAQFFGSLPGVPLLGQVLLGAPLAAFPATLQPSVQQLRVAAGVIPVPGVTPVPGLAALLTSPLPGVAPGQGNNNDDFKVKTNAFAVFTHNIVNVTDRLSLTLGARWNYEKKELDASINNNTGSCAFFFNTSPAAAIYRQLLQTANPALFTNLYLLSCNPAVNTEFNGEYTDDRSESRLTGTAKLAYKFSDDVLGYASYDRGYKSGGYNLDQATFDTRLLGGNGAQGSDLAFEPESVDAFEIGLKTSISREFTFNIAAFYQKFEGLQNLIFSGNSFVVQNIESTTSKGVEAEAIVQPVRDLNFRFGYTYLDARYDEDNDFTGTPLAGAEGERLTNQPEHVVTIAATWTPPITSTLRGLFHVDMRYNSEVNLPSNAPDPLTGRTIVYNPGYPLIAARLGLQTEDRTKSVEFFVENLTNQYYNITAFAVPEQTGTFAGYPSPPRFYGVKARFGF